MVYKESCVCVCHCVCVCGQFNYASVGGAPRHTVVVDVCPSVCVCVILQRAFLRDRDELSNETCNATIARHSTTAKLARFFI